MLNFSFEQILHNSGLGPGDLSAESWGLRRLRVSGGGQGGQEHDQGHQGARSDLRGQVHQPRGGGRAPPER